MRGIITLCGPTKFYKTFDEVMLELTKADWGVFSIGSHRGADSSLNPEVNGYRPLFERLHRDKIAMSEHIVVINKDGYIGMHTQHEIDFSRHLRARGLKPGMRVFWYDIIKAPLSINIYPDDSSWTELLTPEQLLGRPRAK